MTQESPQYNYTIVTEYDPDEGVWTARDKKEQLTATATRRHEALKSLADKIKTARGERFVHDE